MSKLVNLTTIGALLVFCGASDSSLAVALTSGKLAVVRVSSGSLPLAVTGNNVLIDQYDPFTANQVAPLSSIALPTATTSAAGFTLPGALSGGAYNEGRLTLSGDGSTLLLGGYSLKTSSGYVASSNPATNSRVVATIPIATGTPTLNSGFNAFSVGSTGQPFSAVASSNATSFYAGSTGNSIAYFSGMGGGTPTATFSTPDITSARSLSIFNGNLLGMGYNGVFMVNGLPTSGSATSSLLFSTASVSGAGNPQDFIAFDTTGTGSGPNLIYVADSSTTAYSGGIASGGGIQRWDLVGSSWVLSYTLNGINNITTTGVPDNWAFSNITGQLDANGHAQLFVSTVIDGSGRNQLWSVTDNGPQNTGLSPFTILAQSSARNTFRDLVMIPVPTPGVGAMLGLAGLAAVGRRRR